MEFWSFFLFPIGLTGPKLTRGDELFCKGHSRMRQNSWESHPLLQIPGIVHTSDTVAIQISSFHVLIECHATDRHFPANIWRAKDQGLIFHALSQSRRPICPHDAITKGMDFGTSLDSCLIICPGPIGDVLKPPFLFRLQPLFLMPLTTLLFSTPLFAPCRCMVCHLQGAHQTKVGTTPMLLSTDAIHLICIDRCLSSMRPEGMPSCRFFR
jgi:hypothetical protein